MYIKKKSKVLLIKLKLIKVKLNIGHVWSKLWILTKSMSSPYPLSLTFLFYKNNCSLKFENKPLSFHNILNKSVKWKLMLKFYYDQSTTT